MKDKTLSFKKVITKVLTGEKKKGKIRVYFADDFEMRELNRKFRKLDRTTDVLSFPLEEPGDFGEIVISEKMPGKNRLAVHGVLHLLGFDHNTKAQREKMRALEEAYL